MAMNKGKVIKGVGGLFWVLDGNKTIVCKARKKTNYRGETLCVGDFVEYTVEKNYGVIEKVLPPKNRLIRPSVSNIDVLLIVLSPLPEPDYLLVDKLIINAFKNKIEPYVLVNKSDIANDEFINKAIKEYKNFAIDVYTISALTGEGIDELKQKFIGKTVAFAGQSAVGKTSLLNKLTGEDREVGELSVKTEKGRHTTRHNELFLLDGGMCVVDTAGFSVFNELDVLPDELPLYYPELCDFSEKCRYRGCQHIGEPDCEVKRAVQKGEISKDIYERYLVLHAFLIENEKNFYRR